MSVESMSTALQMQGLTPTAKLVLIGIANHDGDGGAWPSVKTLAKYAGCTDRQVQRCVRVLEEAGLLSVKRNEGGTCKTRADMRPNLYILHLDGVTPMSPRALPERGDISERGDTQVTSRGDTQVASGVTPMSPEPSYEPSYETSSLKSVNALTARNVKSRNGGSLIQNDQDARRALKRADVLDAYADTLVKINSGGIGNIDAVKAKHRREASARWELDMWIAKYPTAKPEDIARSLLPAPHTDNRQMCKTSQADPEAWQHLDRVWTTEQALRSGADAQIAGNHATVALSAVAS